jgi:L-amino acid N-acyltransferase YncA
VDGSKVHVTAVFGETEEGMRLMDVGAAATDTDTDVARMPVDADTSVGTDADTPQAPEGLRLAPLEEKHKTACLEILNQIIEEGVAFPWDVPFDTRAFDAKYVPGEPVWCVLDEGDEVLGFVHIKRNNDGRCSHVANCGYSVRREARGRGVGRLLVAKSLEVARAMGYRGMQYNAVVSTNTAAIALYQSFGFEIIGTVPGGFRFGTAADPRFVDMHIMYRPL